MQPFLFIATTALLTACTQAPPPAPVLPRVFVTRVKLDTTATERVLFGSLHARVESELAFRTGGRVIARLVELGERVHAGQALARIDPADYQLATDAALDQQQAAEVDAVQAASDAARFKRLLADGSVGAADAERQQARADAAQARLAAARQQAALARNRAGYATLTAPFDGIVTAVRVEPGQMVSDSQPVVAMARDLGRGGDLELVADVPEALAAGLKGWQPSLRMAEGGPVPLKLRELAPSANPQARTFRARFALSAKPASELRLGQTAELLLRRPGSQRTAELPLSALLAASPGQPPAVWLADADSGALTRIPVEVVSQTTDTVRLAGLTEGSQVVSLGAQKLDAGMKVQLMPRPLAGLQ